MHSSRVDFRLPTFFTRKEKEKRKHKEDIPENNKKRQIDNQKEHKNSPGKGTHAIVSILFYFIVGFPMKYCLFGTAAW